MTDGASELDSPDTFQVGVPHEILAGLRRREPLQPVLGPGGERSWRVTRHADIASICRNPQAFSSGAFGLSAEQRATLVLINMDPPGHTRYRQLVSSGFSPRAVEAMEPEIRRRAQALVRRGLERGECDFVADVAARLPLEVICDLLGIPAEDHDLVLGWSTQMVASEDPEFNSSPELVAWAQTQAFGYFGELARERRSHPGDDLVSRLVGAEIDGERLSELELGLFCILLFIGGNETTRNTLAHAVIALTDHPDQRRRLLADPSLLTTATDEVLRYSSALMQFGRTATADVQMHGETIRAGEKLQLWFTSGNRDETVFADPDAFDVGRAPNPHLSFGGGGPHICLGASLARLEIRLMLEQLLQQAPRFEVTGPAVRLQSGSINGVKHLPVRLGPSTS